MLCVTILKKTRNNTNEQAALHLFQYRSDLNEVYAKKTISAIFSFRMIPVYFPSEMSEKLGREVRELVVSERFRGANFGFKILVRGKTVINSYNKITVQI